MNPDRKVANIALMIAEQKSAESKTFWDGLSEKGKENYRSMTPEQRLSWLQRHNVSGFNDPEPEPSTNSRRSREEPSTNEPSTFTGAIASELDPNTKEGRERLFGQALPTVAPEIGMAVYNKVKHGTPLVPRKLYTDKVKGSFKPTKTPPRTHPPTVRPGLISRNTPRALKTVGRFGAKYVLGPAAIAADVYQVGSDVNTFAKGENMGVGEAIGSLFRDAYSWYKEAITGKSDHSDTLSRQLPMAQPTRSAPGAPRRQEPKRTSPGIYSSRAGMHEEVSDLPPEMSRLNDPEHRQNVITMMNQIIADRNGGHDSDKVGPAEAKHRMSFARESMNNGTFNFKYHTLVTVQAREAADRYLATQNKNVNKLDTKA